MNQARDEALVDSEEHKALIKAAFKEAYKEWLAELAAKFGWYSIKLVGGAGLAALTYFILTMSGWKMK